LDRADGGEDLGVAVLTEVTIAANTMWATVIVTQLVVLDASSFVFVAHLPLVRDVWLLVVISESSALVWKALRSRKLLPIISGQKNARPRLEVPTRCLRLERGVHRVLSATIKETGWLSHKSSF
jgi:hypothetical protein